MIQAACGVSCAGQHANELLVAASTPPTIAVLDSWKIPCAKDCSSLTSLDTYKARGAKAFGGTMLSFQLKTQV